MIIALCFPTTYTNSNSSKKSQFSATHSFSIAIHPINEQLCLLAFWASQCLEVQGWKQMCHSKVPLCPPSHPQLFWGKRNRDTKTYLLDLEMEDPLCCNFLSSSKGIGSYMLSKYHPNTQIAREVVKGYSDPSEANHWAKITWLSFPTGI